MSIDEALASYCKRCGHMQSCERMCPTLLYELNEQAYEPVRLEEDNVGKRRSKAA